MNDEAMKRSYIHIYVAPTGNIMSGIRISKKGQG